ncbi:MAG: hypothetical protein AAF716_05675 [Cyanobacteria bacterium P01_D01_bin.1]
MAHFSTGSSNRSTNIDRMIASVLVAGVTFILGYTVVRASLAQSEQGAFTGADAAAVADSDADIVIPGEGTLWKEFGTSF